MSPASAAQDPRVWAVIKHLRSPDAHYGGTRDLYARGRKYGSRREEAREEGCFGLACRAADLRFNPNEGECNNICCYDW